MPANKRFLFFVAATIVLVTIAGCGGGSSISFPPPQGGFTNASLSGPFAFSYTGSDSQGFLAVAGSFQADGNGHITSGIEDINSGFGITTNAVIAGTSTYTVRADGRGSANLNSTAGNSTIEFVILAGGHALVTRFDSNATGSGTIDQQAPAAFSNTALAGTFAFSLAGIDTFGNPLAVAGNLTADAAGNITSGVDDSNDNGGVVTNDPLTGTIPVAATGRGVATLNTIRGTLTFAYYVVDATHLKLVETDTTLILGGDAFRQTGPFSNASVTGPFAFTVAGADLLSLVPFAAGGVLTSNGAGNITSGVEDFNNSITVSTNVGLTGSYSMAASGRGTLTLNTTAGTFTFVIYPSSGGILVLETDIRFVTSGTAFQQQATAFSNASLSGTYGMNFTGATSSGAEIDSVAQFTADGVSRLTGIIDLNNTGSITFGQPLSATFNVATNGRTTMPLQTPLGTQNLAVYVVDGTRALFIELDPALVAAGEMRHQ
jgi:hypothetical protein